FRTERFRLVLIYLCDHPLRSEVHGDVSIGFIDECVFSALNGTFEYVSIVLPTTFFIDGSIAVEAVDASRIASILVKGLLEFEAGEGACFLVVDT
ncbi:hypothetical protein PMAYCL1PPCAC_22957, partial [Pristionchus mayeri]